MRRRNFLAATATGILGLPALKIQANEKKESKRVLRFIHVTDMHIQPGPTPEKAIKNLLSEIHSLPVKPDFVINSGDSVMDSLRNNKEETAVQWKAWRDYFSSKLEFELFNCIGNHDVWGWSLNQPEIENDPLFGKNWPVKELGIPNRYYSFDKKNWHFIVLDSSYRNKNENTYWAQIDDEQFAWLENDLKTTDFAKPVCIVSHIPILSAAAFFDGENEKSGNWRVPGAWMHIDARKLKDLFRNYPNVKLAISGHLHLADKTQYLGVNYLCNGATSGAWWQGNYQEFPPAYTVIDLNEDGSFDAELIAYKWR